MEITINLHPVVAFHFQRIPTGFTHMNECSINKLVEIPIREKQSNYCCYYSIISKFCYCSSWPAFVALSGTTRNGDGLTQCMR